MSTSKEYPRSFSHIGITVPKIKEAVQFYSEVMGWYIIMEPSKIKKEKETAIGQMCIDVFGEDWEEFEIAHLATSDGIGVELFSFPHGIKEAPEFNPFNTGLFHFCIQDPDIENLIERILAYGGKQRMPIREYYPNDKPYKMCYVEDPFGIVFEIYTHSYELTYSSGAYQNKTM
jgi:lactoylglutathione lyase family protein